MRYLIICLLLACNLTLAGDRVNNGASIAKWNFTHAYLNFKKLIAPCLAKGNCNLDEKEFALLQKINSTIHLEYQNKEQLQFVSENETPGFFRIEESIKAAKTGSTIGSPIYINSDFIEVKTLDNKFRSKTIEEAIAILTHEFGHHHDEDNHELLDLLGIKVSQFVARHIDKAQMFPNSDKIMAMAFNDNRDNNFSKVLIYVGDLVLDASEELEKEVYCKSLTNFNPISYKPTGAIFHNLHWLSEKSRSSYIIIGETTYTFRVKGNLSLNCQGHTAGMINYEKGYKGIISFKMIPKVEKMGSNKTTLKYVKGSLSFDQDYDPWWYIIRLPEFSF